MKRIFQQTTRKEYLTRRDQRKQNDAAETKKEDSETEKKAVENFMKTYYERVQKNDLENLKNMVEDANELTEDQKAIHQYVKKYKNLTYLIKQGADDESYIVYVTYEMKIRKIKTLAPGMTS